jgi:hypothetical protein
VLRRRAAVDLVSYGAAGDAGSSRAAAEGRKQRRREVGSSGGSGGTWALGSGGGGGRWAAAMVASARGIVTSCPLRPGLESLLQERVTR